ncbi:GNAT family N-acetyltransferase [Lentilactobacillus farraginis]|uniref:Acetyltransferase n=1 Tax=Lentilactobacillus farraginis DSM 18382 = JCM 14108 TaxID=1423743 RepID=X0QCG8_9LACO|nr:GNAT family N-acetyltransferase [Lentilactobacillus farraginis]KRM10952.1 acetyltransferase [Lentilactobacillus farraginis DSM 18382 = JCM 14108]GAF36305.1 predicted amino-acid acetyltransferase complementing ArgA function in arginine biosynthesis pathway [Lentilactobacillus farraginis DSM 18382 = JCM 14108]
MVLIRKMKVSDYASAYALWESVPGMNLASLDNSEQGIAKVVNQNPDLCFVAIDGETVVGTALGGTDGRKGYLYHVAVAKAYQGRHLATKLIRKVTAGFKKQGIAKIGLFVVIGNETGKNFWKHQGFKERPDIEYLDLDL